MKLPNPLDRVRTAIHSGMGQATSSGRTFLHIRVDQIDPSKFQPRRSIDGQALKELRESIEQWGVLEPILIRRKEDRFEIISGERRWRACQDLGLEEIPCIIKDVSDEESFKLSLTENLQRNNLTPLEEALAFQAMLERGIARNQAEIGRMLGIRQQRVSDKLRLLSLPPEVQAYFDDFRYQDSFTQKHGEILAKLTDGAQIKELAKRVVDERLSTRETLRLVEKLLKKPKAARARSRQPRRLHISRHRHGFTLKLSFDSRRDSLEDLMRELMDAVDKLQKEFGPAIGAGKWK